MSTAWHTPHHPRCRILEPLDPPGRPGWPLSPYPDGDYHIYLSEDFRFGSFGHPWESSLCIFGAELLDAIAAVRRSLPGSWWEVCTLPASRWRGQWVDA
nr:DUF2716 domain-containing protein [Micromonospora sp. WMMC415]